jgi:hypothetical protein
MTALDEKSEKRHDIVSHELGDEVMLYDAVHEKVHVLNHTGYVIWKLCDGTHTFTDMIEKMHSLFPQTSESTIKGHIELTVKDFGHKNLLL